MSQTIEQRVNEYIGTTVDGSLEALATRIPSINDIAVKAIFDMMKSLPPEKGIRQLSTQTTLSGESTPIGDNVHVYMVIADSREATYVSPGLFEVSSGSIYAPTILDPIYTINTNDVGSAQIKQNPVPSSSKAYLIDATSNGFGDLDINTDKLGEASPEDLTFVPLEVHEAIILDIAAKALQAKIGDMAQDEEDPEMIDVLSKQLQVLQGSYQFELAKILGAPKEAQ